MIANDCNGALQNLSWHPTSCSAAFDENRADVAQMMLRAVCGLSCRDPRSAAYLPEPGRSDTRFYSGGLRRPTVTTNETTRLDASQFGLRESKYWVPPVPAESSSESFQSAPCRIVRQPKGGRLVLLGLHFRLLLFHPAVFSILRETGGLNCPKDNSDSPSI